MKKIANVIPEQWQQQRQQQQPCPLPKNASQNVEVAAVLVYI